MGDVKQSWIKAANTLRENVNARVVCPECNKGRLVVKDELIIDWDNKIDRYMICDYCSKYNILWKYLKISIKINKRIITTQKMD